MSTAAWVGAYLAMVGALLILAEVALAVPMVLRARRHLRTFALWQQSELASVERAVEQLRASGAETQLLLRPFRRIWRWYRHPLTRAYAASRRRKRGAG